MPDYVLKSRDGDVIVTGDGSERARLVGAGWTETTKADAKKASQPKTEPAKADNSPAKPETSNASK
jgi:hypothetical protein